MLCEQWSTVRTAGALLLLAGLLGFASTGATVAEAHQLRLAASHQQLVAAKASRARSATEPPSAEAAFAPGGSTERVSVDSAGNQANSFSFGSAISGDGRFVAFWSNADNLVVGDTNGASDVFVHDRQTDVTERVSVDSAGNQGNSHSLEPAISADGRFVAFRSYANNLVPGDTNSTADVFVHDRKTRVDKTGDADLAGQ